jgi:Cu(I)/Ag(I) efflux system protein CusF
MKSIMFASLTTALLITGCSRSEAPATTTDMPAATESMNTMVESAKTATTKGTIKAIDSEAGKITIAHEPVPAVQWPAMTMAFKATPEQLAVVQVGQAVQFEFQTRGMDATITRISEAD